MTPWLAPPTSSLEMIGSGFHWRRLVSKFELFACCALSGCE